MKKTILYLIAGLVILSSCDKEDDILQPIPNNPTQNTTTNNTTTNVTDTVIVNGDTTITINGIETELINEGLVIDNGSTNTNNGVTVVPTNPVHFVGYNNGIYELTSCEFVMTKLSNSPETYLDTSYTYSYDETECNSYAAFGVVSGFESFVVPTDHSLFPNHTPNSDQTYSRPTARVVFTSDNLIYSNGVLTMDIEYTLCLTAGPISYTTDLDVVQYSDGSFDLIIDIPPTLCSPPANQYTAFTWKSYTKLHFKKQ